MKGVDSAGARSGHGKDFSLRRVASLEISNAWINECDFVTYGHSDPCDEGVAAVADWKMFDCDDGGATPDLSDAEFCGSIVAPPGTIEGSGN